MPAPASRPVTDRLHLEFIQTARRYWSGMAVTDTTGARLTYGRTLTAAFALSRVLARRTAGQHAVGTLLPASAGAALANLALYYAGRMPVNLNFTIGNEALTSAIEQAEITTIVTSKRFLEKAELETREGMIFLEDLRGEIGLGDKLTALTHARFTPLSLLRRWYSDASSPASPLATVIFSSGSTGAPKGVMLTHAAVLANIDQLSRIFPIGPTDVFLGVLPFFHSFGFTGTFWLPLLRGAGAAYHPNPMDAKTIGEVVESHKATFLISTPTFCAAYLRRCTREQFASLKFAIVGAEKLRPQIAAEFRAKYGTELLEGYGCTEMAPVVAVNYPDGPDGEVHLRPGSIGRPIPGVSAKIADIESGRDLGVGDEGLLLVKGANMMSGYLHQPERTAEAIRNGWYVTGDIARIDRDGFIFITDRLSRFSKIGGEMVPHVKIEGAINGVLGEAACVVTAIPDEAKGERLVAFYTKTDVTPGQLWESLGQTDLPRLWLPKRDSLIPIEAIPTLGTGKVDLRSVRQLALERAPTVGATPA